jgi:hypothetical protein
MRCTFPKIAKEKKFESSSGFLNEAGGSRNALHFSAKVWITPKS